MPKPPENNPQNLRIDSEKIPSKQVIEKMWREAEEQAGQEIKVLRSKTPAWSPLMDRIRIGIPGQPSPEEMEKMT